MRDAASSSDDAARADDEALAWVVRLTSGEASEQDHDRFRAWRDAAPAHARALVRARELFLLTELAVPEIGLAPKGLAPAAPAQATAPKPTLPPAHNRRATTRTLSAAPGDAWRRRGRPALWLVAASMMLGVGLGYEYLQVWQFDEITARGEQRSIVLANGTRLELGADTAFSTELSASEQRIRLARGTLLVHAAADRRPLVIETSDAAIRDVGTVFGVERRYEATKVVVREGLVEVAGKGRRVRLRADQRAVVGRDGLAGPATVDAGQELAWTRGRLIAADRPLGEVLAAVSPYASRRVLVIGNAIARRRVSANVDLRNADAWLETLDAFPDTQVTIMPGLVVVR